MRFLIATFLTIVLAVPASLFMPWWAIALAAFIAAFMVPLSKGKAWFSGFLAIFCFWGVSALIINMNNEGILASRIAGILPLNGSIAILILLTAFIGGLVGGMGALSGAMLTRRKKTR